MKFVSTAKHVDDAVMGGKSGGKLGDTSNAPLTTACCSVQTPLSAARVLSSDRLLSWGGGTAGEYCIWKRNTRRSVEPHTSHNTTTAAQHTIRHNARSHMSTRAQLYLSRSLGRTPSHLMSGVVRLAESYDMAFEPFMYTDKIFNPVPRCVATWNVRECVRADHHNHNHNHCHTTTTTTGGGGHATSAK